MSKCNFVVPDPRCRGKCLQDFSIDFFVADVVELSSNRCISQCKSHSCFEGRFAMTFCSLKILDVSNFTIKFPSTPTMIFCRSCPIGADFPRFDGISFNNHRQRDLQLLEIGDCLKPRNIKKILSNPNELSSVCGLCT